jgi:hypothetical protein
LSFEKSKIKYLARILATFFIVSQPLLAFYTYSLFHSGFAPEKIKEIIECEMTEKPTDCYYNLGYEKRDLEMCERIRSWEVNPPYSGNIAVCIKGYVDATNDKEKCEKIAKGELREMCFKGEKGIPKD